MTKTWIIERYSKELEYIKRVMNLSEKELEIYIAGYVDGQACTLEELKYKDNQTN